MPDSDAPVELGARGWIAALGALAAMAALYTVALFGAAPDLTYGASDSRTPVDWIDGVEVERPPRTAQRIDSGAVVSDLEGRPLADVRVVVEAGKGLGFEAFGCYGPPMPYWARSQDRTDSEGRFEVWEDSLAQDEMRVHLTRPGWLRVRPQSEVNVFERRERYRMAPTRDVRIRIVDRRGSPIASRQVLACSRQPGFWSDSCSSFTDEGGEVTLQSIDGWSLELWVDSPGGRRRFEPEPAAVDSGHVVLRWADGEPQD